MTYTAYIRELLLQKPIGMPIYTKIIAASLAEKFNLKDKDAVAATAVAMKRIMDSKVIPELRFYQKGIYFRTVTTPFGERGINKESLIADKYLLPDKGYETGFALLHDIGLATQMPKERVIATNMAKDCTRMDKKLGVTIRPPKAEITAENKSYLQTLDTLELLDKAPIDAEHPYSVIASHIHKLKLQYEKLLFLADRYYNKNTVIQLAHTAGEGGYAL